MFSEVLEGSPITKWCEIMLHASPTLATNELKRLLDLLAAYEVAFEKSGLDFREFVLKNESEINEAKFNIAIESSAKILSENE